jgi:hypothetical protein
MTTAVSGEQPTTEGQGPKFFLDFEGVQKPWDQAILIDKDNNERTLAAGEVVELKPGMGFSKKIRFKRG